MKLRHCGLLAVCLLLAGGAYSLMADGSVRFLGERTSPEVLRALGGVR
jgi:hypothetical protein